jgi:hypothetical protein
MGIPANFIAQEKHSIGNQAAMQLSKVFVIALCYGDADIGGMLDVAEIFVGNNFPNAETKWLIVDNKLVAANESYWNGKLYINGDNSQQEFSGWQRGIDYLKAHFQPSNADAVVFLNDTVHRRNYTMGGNRYYEGYRINYDGPTPEAWAAGYLDDFPVEASVNGLKFSNWIRSNLYTMNWQAVQLITPLVFPCSVDEVFDNINRDRFWGEHAPMSANWMAYISSWLFGTEDARFPEYRLKWIRFEKLCDENRRHFQSKALSILSEHYLTARLLKSNVKLFDFNTYPKMPDRHISPYYN